ncbi:mechanosensitive ion channel family protein [Anaerolineales bacterium]
MLRDLLSETNLPQHIQDLILQIVVFVVAIMLIVLLRRVISWILLSPLRKLANHSQSSLPGVILDSIVGPLRFVIIAFGLVLATNLIALSGSLEVFIRVIANTMLIVAVFYAMYNTINIVAEDPNRLLRLTGLYIPNRLLPFLRTLLQLLIMTLGALVVLQEWGINVSALIASLGIAGAALAFAAKDTVENFFGFAAIIGDQPFDIGDFISTPDVTGTVERVGPRSSRVRQRDQALVTVPNRLLSNTAVLNWTKLYQRRINMTVKVTYGTTSDELRILVYRIRSYLRGRKLIDRDNLVVHFVEFNSSSLDVLIICTILEPDWGLFTAEKEHINLGIMEIVQDLGLSFAFPSHSVYMEPNEKAPGEVKSPITEAELHLAKNDQTRSPSQAAMFGASAIGDDPGFG